jgi:2,3-bisphosphoglycerate-dependent phosphoglycerate mutase
MKSTLILLRHGQSLWNKMNLFTGWVDVPLSEKGIAEAFDAGKKIAHLSIDVIYVSTLMRAQMTAMIAMSVHSGGKVPLLLHPEEKRQKEWGKIHSPKSTQETIPLIKSEELNERYYGKLQGLNKKDAIDQYGEDQVYIWRRSFDTPPPGGECLADTAARAIPYFQEKVIANLDSGQNVLISAHGNSLRAIIKHLEGLSKEEVFSLEISTGVPQIYYYEQGQFHKHG